ncbi:MAG: aldolase/citrate lyase family protein [Nocardioidaceae bacterium]
MHDGLAAEVESILEAGADSLMFPYFETDREVMDFVRMVDGRAQACLLLETSRAVSNLQAILAQPGIDRVHIGINDLHLDMGLDFMFQLLSNGVIESLKREIERPEYRMDSEGSLG